MNHLCTRLGNLWFCCSFSAELTANQGASQLNVALTKRGLWHSQAPNGKEILLLPSPHTKHGLLYLQLPLNLLCHQGWLYDPELLVLLPPPGDFWASITRPGSRSARYGAQGFLHVRQALDQLCCISSQHFDFLNENKTESLRSDPKVTFLLKLKVKWPGLTSSV